MKSCLLIIVIQQKEEEDVPASSRAPPLGEARLKVLQFLTSLVKQNTSAVNERILELEIPDVILVSFVLFHINNIILITYVQQLMFRHGLNNVLHCEVVKFMRSALHADTLKYTVCLISLQNKFVILIFFQYS